EERIDRKPVVSQEVDGFRQHGFAGEHRGLHIAHQLPRPRMKSVRLVEVREERAGIADDLHERLNLRRRFVAERPEPETLPARSAVSAYTEPRSLGASTRSRTSAATLRPVAFASLRSRRSVASGSLMVMPFMVQKGNSPLSERQYRSIATQRVAQV